MWKSAGLSRKFKRNLFVSTVESVLLHTGCSEDNVDVLQKDPGYTSTEERRCGMLDRDMWRGVISRA
ncbi:unnamed protein product [Merluccius merluccius]